MVNVPEPDEKQLTDFCEFKASLVPALTCTVTSFDPADIDGLNFTVWFASICGRLPVL